MKKRRRIPRIEQLEPRDLPSASWLGSAIAVDQPLLVQAPGVNNPGPRATADGGRVFQLSDQPARAESGIARAAGPISPREDDLGAAPPSPPHVIDEVLSDPEVPLGLFELAAHGLPGDGFFPPEGDTAARASSLNGPSPRPAGPLPARFEEPNSAARTIALGEETASRGETCQGGASVPGETHAPTDGVALCPSQVFLCGFPPLLVRKVEPLRPGSRGYLFLCNYTEKAVRTEERRHGPLPDHEDIVHQVFVEWREQVGADEEHLTNLLDKDSPERQVLRRTVPRVISRARYANNKFAEQAGATDLPAKTPAAAQNWTDLRIDLEQGVGNLTPCERQILELRRQGKTFDEIGTELGMAKQRASEVCAAVVARLQSIYSRG